jgi:hypothetical protein
MTKSQQRSLDRLKTMSPEKQKKTFLHCRQNTIRSQELNIALENNQNKMMHQLTMSYQHHKGDMK